MKEILIILSFISALLTIVIFLKEFYAYVKRKKDIFYQKIYLCIYRLLKKIFTNKRVLFIEYKTSKNKDPTNGST